MSKGLGILAAAAFVFTALAYPVAFAIAGTATEAYLIAGKDPTAVAVEQELFEPPKGASKDSKEYRDAVLRIYGVPTDGWELLRVDDVRDALAAFPPGRPLRSPVELGDGLFVAGDHRDTPSIQGALTSGHRAAQAIRGYLTGTRRS
jgi:hypothetical protein